MFISINGKDYNMLCIQSVIKSDIESESGTSYNIDYRLQNGELIIEEFNNESDRNSKFDEVVGE